MRLFNSSPAALASIFLTLLASTVSAVRVFESSSLDSCQANSSFTASLFEIAFFPSNKTLKLNINGDALVSGNVTLKIQAAAYGYVFLKEDLDPCTITSLSAFCPLNSVQISFDTIYNNISANIVDRIPSIAYGIPDLDATVTVYMYAKDDPSVSLACVRSRISNGKTVNQNGVKWGTAVVAGLGLVTSALVSGLGNFNTAAHVSLYASALFNYFQAVAIIGLCAVPLPPLTLSWTQDFNWSLGIIRVTFLQKLATWYQRATGGKPDTILATLGTKSVHIAKRALHFASVQLTRSIYPRTAQVESTPSGEYTVSGMNRVAFRSNMEPTNLFLTGLIFYCIFVIVALLGLMIAKGICELALRRNWFKSQSARLQTFHDKWLVLLKGCIYRMIMLGYPLMTILCLWEFKQDDSSAEIFLAVIFFFGMTGALVWAAFNVIQTAKRSGRKHETPAFLLYSDPIVLNKWGFLYIPFRADAYYYVVPILAYSLLKALFVGLIQNSGKTQAVALLLIEAIALIGASVLRPWMDKTANTVNIAICAVNFVNAIFLLIFTDIFKGPGLLIGVVGVVFFFLNAIFALILLITVLTATIVSLIRKNPDARYQPISDNRASFIKSQLTLPTNNELDDLGFAARGDDHDAPNHMGSEKDLHNAFPSTAYGGGGLASPSLNPNYASGAVSPSGLHTPAGGHSRTSYERSGSQERARLSKENPRSSHEHLPAGANLQPFVNYDRPGSSPVSRPGSSRSNGQNEKSSNSPWQRGAGYEH